ncbi:trigger factor [Candidatus Peregrinibacteria bacterium]|nr:trigger factor [Candidatus Peregrinibacteria bacterium]
MKSTLKKLPKSQVEITITVPYEEYEKAEKHALEEISKELKVEGFRPGHIPENVIREKVDEETIRGVAMEHLLPMTYTKAVQEHKADVIARPKIDIKTPIKKKGDELTYVAVVSVMPEVKMGDYRKIKVAREPVKVEPKQVEETLQMILDRFAEWKDVAGKAQKGHRAEVSFEGFDEKGAAIAGTASKNHPVVLGAGVMVPGFEEAIIDMAVGESKEFDVDFPKEYHAEPMKGKKVRFKATLGRLEEKIAKELTEELVEKVIGEKLSVADFKKRVEDDLKAEMEARARREHDAKVVQEVMKITKVDLPDDLINEELQYMKEEHKQRVAKQGLTWEQYLKHIKKTDEDFMKDNRKGAEERLLARMGVQSILKDSKIDVTDEEAVAEVEKMAAKYPENVRKQVHDHYKPGTENWRSLKNNMAADKLIDMLSK